MVASSFCDRSIVSRPPDRNGPMSGTAERSWVPDQVLGACGEAIAKGATPAGAAHGMRQRRPSACARCPPDSARAGAHETQDVRLSLPFPLGGGCWLYYSPLLRV